MATRKNQPKGAAIPTGQQIGSYAKAQGFGMNRQQRQDVRQQLMNGQQPQYSAQMQAQPMAAIGQAPQVSSSQIAYAKSGYKNPVATKGQLGKNGLLTGGGKGIKAKKFNDSLQGQIKGQDAANVANIGRQDLMNRVNENTTFGGASYGVDDQGRVTRDTYLSPEQQNLYNSEMGTEQNLTNVAQNLSGGLQNKLSQDFNYNNIAKLPGVDDFSADRSRIEDSLYGRYEARMTPRFEQEMQSFNQSMINRGIQPGTKQYDREYQNLKQSQNDALLDARAQAVAAGGAEQGRMFGQGLQARQQGVGEANYLRQQPISEIGSLYDIGSGVRQPNVSPVGQIDVLPTNYADIAGTYRGQNKQVEIAKANNAAELALQREREAAQSRLEEQRHQNEDPIVVDENGDPVDGGSSSDSGSAEPKKYKPYHGGQGEVSNYKSVGFKSLKSGSKNKLLKSKKKGLYSYG